MDNLDIRHKQMKIIPKEVWFDTSKNFVCNVKSKKCFCNKEAAVKKFLGKYYEK